ncbi:SoxR reducing system RseC family protein [Paraneptunicella aestuarii]|uniref:SoxR reducing system RseC family protein n=1 Tax=Paraneptunicella aestuarii TaxID=2831148 RepID=UPI001E618373|nr:SoxR reducing system RseC family protein [Paraneptunicella aestuarii]UAA40072.1 SoxR reducing system RseC family protein [Paraneptunicella aestuarii]
MIEEIGVVKHVDGQHLIVSTEMKNACQSCAQRSHCGTGAVARALANKENQILVARNELDDDFQAGQQVRLGVSEEKLLAASSIMYLVPLLALIIGALLGQQILPLLGFHAESWLVLFTVVWMWGTYRILRIWTQSRCQQQFNPVLLGKAEMNELVQEDKPV